jgi:nucleoside-diphosphate-sugar epimerase
MTRYLVTNEANVQDAHLEPTFGARRQGDVMHSAVDIEKSRTLLGYEPSITFEEGLERTVPSFLGAGSWGRWRATT